MSVIGVNYPELARSQPERRRSKPFVDHRSHAPHGPGLGLVRVYEVRLQPKQFAQDFEDDDDVTEAQFAAHFLDDERLHAGGPREIAHIALALGNDAGDERRFEPPRIKPGRQPRDVFGRAADVEPVNNSDDAYSLQCLDKLRTAQINVESIHAPGIAKRMERGDRSPRSIRFRAR